MAKKARKLQIYRKTACLYYPESKRSRQNVNINITKWLPEIKATMLEII
ncbi:MAG: hypothetical protein SXA11_23165 [Cyanobacteriota bacterium]|nr:hypothetical protein [Cyanobacteriota bacterium]